MAFTFPVMIRPIDTDMEVLSSTKCKFHYLTLENDIVLQERKSKRFTRQFIHEINEGLAQDWNVQNVLSIYLNSKLIEYDQYQQFKISKSEENPFVNNIDYFRLRAEMVSHETANFYNDAYDAYCLNKSTNNLNLFYLIHFEEYTVQHTDRSFPSALEIDTSEDKSRLEFSILKDKIAGYNYSNQDITIHLKFVYKDYYDIIQIVVTRERNTWFGAIDFGSEASQMKFVSSLNLVNPPPAISNIDIDFIGILEAIQKSRPDSKITGQTLSISEIKYWQQDEDIHDNLYRSVFPAENIHAIRKTNYFLDDTSDHFRVEFLKSINAKFGGGQSYLPNLKLLKQLEIFQSDPNIQSLLDSIKKALFIENTQLNVEHLIGQVYPILMANMISLGILGLLSNEKLNNYLQIESSHKVLSPSTNIVIRVLVPNMFQSEEIYLLNNTLQELLINLKFQLINKLALDQPATQKIFNHLASNNFLLDAISRLNGIEFMVMAEGDAVAVERNRQTHSQKFKDAKKFIVIDCGKGTTDVSIFRKPGKEQVLDTLYRGGFAGAGNAISKAVFDDFVREIEIHLPTQATSIGEGLKSLQEALQDLRMLEISEQLNVGRLIEALKKSYFSNSSFPVEFKAFQTVLLKSSGISNPKEAIGQFTANLIEAINFVNGKKWTFTTKQEDLYTEKTIKDIINEIIYQLKIGGLSANTGDRPESVVVILSGRIFKSDILTQRFINDIGKEFGLDITYSINSSTEDNKNFSRTQALKKRCVEGGVEERPALNLNSDINGIPMFVKVKPYSKLKRLFCRQKNANKLDEKITPLGVKPHEYEFYTENILHGSDLLDGSESRLLLNRLNLILDPTHKDKIEEIYFIGRGFLGIARRGKNFICGPLKPDYQNFYILQDENPNADDSKIQKEIKSRYLKLLADSFFPFV